MTTLFQNGAGRVTIVVRVQIEVNDQQRVARCGNVGDNVAEDENTVGVRTGEIHAYVNQLFI